MKTQLKKPEEMNYYEVLNISASSSQQDIQQAYQVGKNAFAAGSLAHYGLVDPAERVKMLRKIEDAFKTLSSPRKRKKYDVKILKLKSEGYENAYFRSSTEKMLIEDGDIKPQRRSWIKRLFRRD